VFTEFDRNIAVSFDLNITVSQWPNLSELNTLAGAVNVKKIGSLFTCFCCSSFERWL